MNFSPYDGWTIRDACEGVQIFGAIGSSKTSGSGANIAKAFLKAGFGGVVFCAKPEERALWQEYKIQTGRMHDVIIFSPEQPYRFNFFDYELRREGRGGGITENLVNLIAIVTEIAEGKQQMQGGDSFWERSMQEMVFCG